MLCSRTVSSSYTMAFNHALSEEYSLKESFESFCEEEGFMHATVSHVWRPQIYRTSYPFFRIYFKSDNCPICARAHEKDHSFYHQTFSDPNVVGEALPPLARFGCSRSEENRKVLFHPCAEPLFMEMFGKK